MAAAILELDPDTMLARRCLDVVNLDLLGCDERSYPLREIDRRHFFIREQKGIEVDLRTAMTLEPVLEREGRSDETRDR